MNWDQIESSWAAMTRRVRPDWPEFGKSNGAFPQEPADAPEQPPTAADIADTGAKTEPASEPLRIG